MCDITVFNKESVSDELIIQHFNFINSIWEEMHPSEPLPSYDSFRQHFFEPIPNKQTYSWLAFKNGELVGSCDLILETPLSPFFEERKSIGQFWMNVAKEHRRKGLGTNMLRTILKKTSEFDYVELIQLTGATPLEESIAFCEKFQGEVTFESEENRIYIKDIDWDKIQNMNNKNSKIMNDFTFEIFEEIPEFMINDYAVSFSELRHNKPYKELSEEDKITPERLRNFENQLVQDEVKWIHFVIKDSDGQIMALSNLRYELESLERVNETFGGVRGNGNKTKFVEYLKSEMLLYIRNKLPKVDKIFIWFENCMFEDLNKEIGFTKHYQGKHFKFKLKELKKLI